MTPSEHADAQDGGVVACSVTVPPGFTGAPCSGSVSDLPGNTSTPLTFGPTLPERTASAG
jgi:hypothetical protein